MNISNNINIGVINVLHVCNSAVSRESMVVHTTLILLIVVITSPLSITSLISCHKFSQFIKEQNLCQFLGASRKDTGNIWSLKLIFLENSPLSRRLSWNHSLGRGITMDDLITIILSETCGSMWVGGCWW